MDSNKTKRKGTVLFNPSFAEKITYEILVPYVKKGIKDVCKEGSVGKFEFAFRGGNYIGAPGKEIYFGLKNLNSDQMQKIAELLSAHFPKKKIPDNHVKWAACLRYIYGCFEKQGCLRSDADMERIITERPDWTLPTMFMDVLLKVFERDSNYYGLTLLYEMRAHRAGDQVLIDSDPSKIDAMIALYKRSTEYAAKINCVKHLFANIYWAACYCEKIGDHKRALKLHKDNIEAMAQYCPDSREGYQSKATDSLRYIQKHIVISDWSNWYNSVLNGIKNPDVRKWAIWGKCRREMIKRGAI